MVVASTELSIEKNRFLLNKYRNKLKNIQGLESDDLSELEDSDDSNAENYFENDYADSDPGILFTSEEEDDRENQYHDDYDDERCIIMDDGDDYYY